MYSRPTVRLFYTYAKWNDSAKFAGIAGQGPSVSAQIQKIVIASLLRKQWQQRRRARRSLVLKL
jgi:hypothetical protein